MGRSLDGIRGALRRLGSPQDSYPVILIGGTNGKGSTSAMVDEIVRAAGYRTGRFESPSWGADHEHVQIDGSPVESGLFADCFLRADASGDLTWFEAVTAAAFQCFEARRVDLAVVEVGLGGIADCTNVVRDPIASVIVSVALDHQQFLGSTIAEIATEKAGIFRFGRPALVGWVDEEAESAIRREASRLGARLIRCPEAISPLNSIPDGRTRQRVRIGELPEIALPLAGDFQVRNAALATMLVEQIRVLGFNKLSSEAVVRGLSQVSLNGRLEWLTSRCRPVLLDTAHNPAAVSRLVEHLEAQATAPVDFLFGCFADKDAETMLKHLLPIAGSIQPVSSDHSRSMPVEKLAEMIPEEKRLLGDASDLDSVLQAALSVDGGVLCITGSMDLVKSARRRLISKAT